MSCFSLTYTLNRLCRGVITDDESASPRVIPCELRPTRSSSAGWLLASVVPVLLFCDAVPAPNMTGGCPAACPPRAPVKWSRSPVHISRRMFAPFSDVPKTQARS